MSWMRLWRFAVGYVWFQAEGGFPEKFVSDAAAAGISLSESRREGELLFACCAAKDYRRLRPLARRACMRLRLVRKSGLYFRLFPYRKRAGVPVGLVLAAVLLTVLSRRIWIVQPEGNAALSDEKILETAAALGVYPGCRIEDIDMELLRLRALDLLPETVYVSVNPSGCVARVAVSEREPAPDIQNFKKNFSNLVAARDGKILSTEIYSGQGTVAVGEGVTAGTLLVSGAVESASGNTVLRRSAGKIMAQTVHTLSVTVPFTEEELLPDGNTFFRPSLRFLSWEIPLYTCGEPVGDYAVSVYRHLPRRGELTIPIGFIHRRYDRLQRTAVPHTVAEAALLAEQRLAAQKEALGAAGVSVLEETDKKIEKTDSGYILTVVCRCEEDIAKEVPLQTVDNF